MPLDIRLVGRAFPTAAVNYGVAEPHYDWNDYIDGLSLLIPYGNFEGGELVFRDLGLCIKCKAGDVVAFNSANLLHENLEVRDGVRYSIVFFSPVRIEKVRIEYLRNFFIVHQISTQISFHYGV